MGGIKSLLGAYANRLNPEGVFWAQRSRLQWLKHGDRNSKCFHATTQWHSRSNRIVCLNNDEGHTVTSEKVGPIYAGVIIITCILRPLLIIRWL